MDIDLALLADAATVDASGKLNILGVFDRITAGEFPARHGRVAMVLRFSAGLDDAGTHEMVLRIKGPSGEELASLSGNIQFGPGGRGSGGRIKVPHVLNLDGIVFENPGRYSFDVSVDGEHQVSIPLTVATMPGSGAAQA